MSTSRVRSSIIKDAGGKSRRRVVYTTLQPRAACSQLLPFVPLNFSNACEMVKLAVDPLRLTRAPSHNQAACCFIHHTVRMFASPTMRKLFFRQLYGLFCSLQARQATRRLS
jgi:hypothetical protein